MSISTKPRTPLCPVFSSDGHFVTDDEEMARELNNYFSNVFTVEDVDNISDPAIVHAGENILTDIDCAEPEVEEKLKELKPDKAAVSDAFCQSSQGCSEWSGPAPLTDLLLPRQRCP